jgi:hypothetical protein
VLAWLSRHPRWMFHFTPTLASWLNAVENFFSKMTRQRIRRGVFRSIVDLQTAINAYLAVWGCRSVSPHVRQKAMIDHKCFVGRPEKDDMAAGGVHGHFARTSNRGRLTAPVDVKDVYLPEGPITKSDESLVRRFDGLIYVPLTRAGSRATAFSGRSLPPTISISPPDKTDGL